MILRRLISETPGLWRGAGPLGIYTSRIKEEKKEAARLLGILSSILVLLTGLSAGRFNLVIIFLDPAVISPPSLRYRLWHMMIPANCVDKFKGLKIANSGFTGADLQAGFRAAE